MNKTIEYNDLVEIKNNKRIKKSNIKLYIDCIYKNKSYAQNFSNDILSVLMNVGNRGGFRYSGSKNKFNVNYVVLFSTNKDVYWQDKLDVEMGLYVYYGDNQQPGRNLHDTNGNQILRDVYELAQSDNFEDRNKIPPFFLFERDDIGGVKFSGLLVPGYKGIISREWLTAIWAKRDEGGRFQNYKALFTILNLDKGCEANSNAAEIDLRWLDDLKNNRGYDSKYAPVSWKNWIYSKIYYPLTINSKSKVRTKEEQLPSSNEKMQMLKDIYNYFSQDLYLFEEFAITITTLADDNILNCENTRPTKDGGRDGIGEYKILKNLKNFLKATFALEAKCYDINNSVGVKETSRLISRIKYRQFGVFVTTSYVAKQAYDEIIEDEHPIAIISGRDIIDILFNNGVTNKTLLNKFLTDNFKI